MNGIEKYGFSKVYVWQHKKKLTLEREREFID